MRVVQFSRRCSSIPATHSSVSIFYYTTIQPSKKKMLGAVTASTTTLRFSPSTKTILVQQRIPNSTLPLSHAHSFSLLSSPPLHFSLYKSCKIQPHFFAEAASSSSGEIMLSLSFIFNFFCLKVFAFSSTSHFPISCRFYGKLIMQTGE